MQKYHLSLRILLQRQRNSNPTAGFQDICEEFQGISGQYKHSVPGIYPQVYSQRTPNHPEDTIYDALSSRPSRGQKHPFLGEWYTPEFHLFSRSSRGQKLLPASLIVIAKKQNSTPLAGTKNRDRYHSSISIPVPVLNFEFIVFLFALAFY